MDRPISFASSSGLSPSGSFIRGDSPSSSRPGTSDQHKPFSDLESNTSALGHVGLLKHQREALRNQLQQQCLINGKQKQATSSLRKLALRLSVQISVREARLKSHAEALSRSRLAQYLNEKHHDSTLKRLLTVLKGYEDQGQDLLRALDNGSPVTSKSKSLTSHAHFQLTQHARTL
jgi:hypothetical protein